MSVEDALNYLIAQQRRKARVGRTLRDWIRIKRPDLTPFMPYVTEVQASFLLTPQNWYDRNLTNRTNGVSVTAAPHALVERLRYTCPAAKIAILELLEVSVHRETAAAPVGGVNAYWTYNGIAILTAHISTNTPGDKDKYGIGTQITMLEGDYVSGHTIDLSTGGTVTHRLAYKASEFDVM